MVVEIIRYRLASGQAEAFLEAYNQAQKQLTASPNCLGYRLVQCAKDADRFALTIDWDSTEGHLTGFRRGPHFPQFYALVAPFVDRIEEMEHYEPTGIAWTREALS